MRMGDSLRDHPQARGQFPLSRVVKNGSPTAQDASLYAAAVIADAQVQRGIHADTDESSNDMRRRALQAFSTRLSSADQCVAVAKARRLAHRSASARRHPQFGSAAARNGQQLGGVTRSFSGAIAPGEHQHVANLVLQLVQARFRTAGETLLLLLAQATLLKVAAYNSAVETVCESDGLAMPPFAPGTTKRSWRAN